MPRLTKRHKKTQELIDKTKIYELKEAVSLAKKTAFAKFDETVDLSIKLNVNPKEVSQAIRGTVALPNGTGKKVRVCAFCKGEKSKEAQDAGADFVGAGDLVEKIQGGWCDFDVAVATPEMMPKLAVAARVLGPRGLMPNPKTGTVGPNVTQMITDL